MSTNDGTKPRGSRLGVPNRATQYHQKMLARGDKPDAIDAMCFKMDAWLEEASAIRKKAKDANRPMSVDERAAFFHALDKVHEVGKDIAPYHRNRLASLEVAGVINHRIRDLKNLTEQELDVLERLAGLDAADDRGDSSGTPPQTH